jgi:putative transposase
MTRARKTYPPDFKVEAVRLVREDGMSVARVASCRGVDSTLVREWVKKADEAALTRTPAATTVASMADELVHLRRENAVLREEHEIPKKPRPSSRRRPGDDVPVHRLGEGQPRSPDDLPRHLRVARSLRSWRRAKPVEVESEACIRVHIRGLYRASRGTYGSPRVTAALRKQGVLVNHNRVARLMRAEGLQGLPRRRFRGSPTDLAHARPVVPNVLARDFSAQAPVSDASEISRTCLSRAGGPISPSSLSFTAARLSAGRSTSICVPSFASPRSGGPSPRSSPRSA